MPFKGSMVLVCLGSMCACCDVRHNILTFCFRESYLYVVLFFSLWDWVSSLNLYCVCLCFILVVYQVCVSFVLWLCLLLLCYSLSLSLVILCKGCFSQNFPKWEIVRFVILWFAAILLKYVSHQDDDQDVLTCWHPCRIYFASWKIYFIMRSLKDSLNIQLYYLTIQEGLF